MDQSLGCFTSCRSSERARRVDAPQDPLELSLDEGGYDLHEVSCGQRQVGLHLVQELHKTCLRDTRGRCRSDAEQLHEPIVELVQDSLGAESAPSPRETGTSSTYGNKAGQLSERLTRVLQQDESAGKTDDNSNRMSKCTAVWVVGVMYLPDSFYKCLPETCISNCVINA